MKLLAFCLLLGMSAQGQDPCQSAKLYYDGVLVDEEPHCGFLFQTIHMPTALDDITRAEFAQAAQRAADETDGKPELWSWPDGKILWIDPKVDPHKPWDEVGPLGDGLIRRGRQPSLWMFQPCRSQYQLPTLVYMLFKGQIPQGYELDHI